MSIEVHTYRSVQAAQEALEQLCAQAIQQGKRPVVLVAGYPQVLATRRTLAQHGAGFGVEVASVSSWVADLWALFGSGGTPLSPVQRQAYAAAVLAEQQHPLPQTPGTLQLLAQAAREALVYCQQPAALVGNEQALVELLQAYEQRIHANNYCEYCEMCIRLSTADALVGYAPILFNMQPAALAAAEQELLEAAGACVVQTGFCATPQQQRCAELQSLLDNLFTREAESPAVQAQGALVCALSAGPTAANYLVHRSIEDALELQPAEEVVRICVALPAPEEQFAYSAPLLAERGIGLRLHASKPVLETSVGRAIVALVNLVGAGAEPSVGLDAGPDALDKLEAADFSHNPFAGIWYGSAFRLDQSNRSNRLMDASEVLSGLAGNAAPELQGTIGLFEEGDYMGALDILERYAKDCFAARPAYKQEQLQAIQAARSAIAAAQNIGAPIGLVVAALATQPIAIHAEIPGEGLVEFCTLEHAAMLEAASVDALLIGSLDVAHYPIRSTQNALQTLLAKWGKARETDPLWTKRSAFFAALAAARQRVYVQRNLNDATAEPIQAASLFEELMDCYRIRLASYDDMDATLGIVQSLAPFALQAGEDALVRNARGQLAAAAESSATLYPAGTIDQAAKELLVLPRSYHGQHFEGVDLSASQIESYLECPYQWFAKRRLRIEGIDEGFGVLERGTFMHNVLQAFYVRFIEQVAPKLTVEHLDKARAILAEVFVEQSQRDLAERSPGNRYVPTNAWEQQVHNSLLAQLQKSLEYETAFLPHFHPQYMEWGYGEVAPFSYAGCNLCGRIDRIDTDEAGHAVVVDYKSSLSADYHLRANVEEETFVLPRKMQTLIYAQAVRKELGLTVVGALYFNPLTGMVRGAYDAGVLGPADFPNFKSGEARANEVPGPCLESFDDLLDTSERLVAQSIDQLVGGAIDPAPHSPEVCKYCPVGNCRSRLSARKV